MSRDSGTEHSGQRTVAELLAQYGGDAPRNGPRRRRRAADPSDTAPQEIIDRVNSESGPLRAVPGVQPPHSPEAPSGPAVRGNAAPTRAPAPQEPAADRSEHAAHDHWKRRFVAELPTGAPTRPADSNGESPPFGDVEETAQQPMLLIRPQSQPAQRPAGPDVRPRQVGMEQEARTEQFRPFTERPASDPLENALTTTLSSYRQRTPTSDAASELSEADDSDHNERADYGVEEVEPADHAPDDPETEIPRGEPEAAEQSGSTHGAWLMLALQVSAGMLGGAGVYVGFRWLWLSIPVAAVAAAVAVTGCLVFLVRRSSDADDLQTVVLALLVGLACTVSPVAVMLLGR